MEFLIPFIYFSLSNATMVFICKKSFGKCLPLTIMLTAFSLFFSQVLFKTFYIGYIINIIFALFSIVLCLANIKNKNYKKFLDNYLTNGLYAFITIYFFVVIFDFKRSFNNWDEWSHWGVMVKEMFRLDKFYYVDSSTLLVHKDYPPIVQLFELFWIKLCNGYSETKMIRALHTLELSLIIPAISELKFKKNNIFKMIIVSFASCFSLLLIIAFFDQHGIINSIYIDYFLAILTSYSIFSIIQNFEKYSNFLIFLLVVSGSFLLLTKQMGIPLYLMILFLYFAEMFIIKKEYKNITKQKLIISSVILVLIPFLILLTWNNEVKNIDIEKQFVLSDIKVTQLPNIIAKKSGEEYQQISANNYISAIKNRNITTSYIELTYFQSCGLALSILYLIYKFYKIKDDKKQFSLLLITLILGILGYAFVMLNLYVFCFGNSEGPSLASIDRYLATFVILLFVVDLMIYLLFSQKSDNESIGKYLVLVTILFIIQSPGKCDSLYSSYQLASPNKYELHANNIKKYVKNNDKVYVIAQNSFSDYNYFINYYLDSIFINIKNYTFDVGDEIEPEKYFKEIIEKDILKYDYVYVAAITDEFVNNYSFLFKDDIEEGKMYKIDTIKPNIKLLKIN